MNANVLLAGIILCGMVSCQSNKQGASVDESGFPREKTLYVGGLQWSDPNTFNPLADQPAFPGSNGVVLMYEPLMVYNTLTGKIEPSLGRSYEQTRNAISVVIDPRARWSDGVPVTSADVRFTFEIGKRFKNALTAYVWDFISDITVDTMADTAAGSTGKVEKVNFVINKKVRNNPLGVLDILQVINIAPQHTLEPMLKQLNDNFSDFQKLKIDRNPVVSGPYTLLDYTIEKIVLRRRDDYWGNARYKGRLPAPEYIIHPIYKSNDHYSIALQQGTIDVSQTFIPRIWLKAKDGVHTWFSKEPYYIPACIPGLTINHTRYPLSDRNVRRAMAFAINYNDIRELAVNGYSPEVKSGLILPFGVEKQYYSEDDAAQYGTKYDPEQAKKIMAEAGYKPVYDNSGNLVHVKNAKGEIVPTMYIKSPVGWTDWEIMVRLAVKDLRAAGIDVREGFVDAGIYQQNLPVGDFDMIMFSAGRPVSPANPWGRFEATMSSGSWRPIGDKVNENHGRYNKPGSVGYNPAVDSLLKVIPILTNQDAIAKAYRALNIIFMQDQVSIPLIYRPDQFYEFNSSHWTHLPTAEDPYSPPLCLVIGAGVGALWEIRPVAAK